MNKHLASAHRDEGHSSPCLAMLRGVYPDLTEAERRVADSVLAEPGRVLISSIAELARESGAGLGTVGRLCNKLGYPGYPDMKIALAVEIYNPEYDAPAPVEEDDDASVVIGKVMRFASQNLNDTVAMLDPGELSRAARAIAGARRVELYATGGISVAVAYVLQHRLLVGGVPCGVFAAHPQQQNTSADLLAKGEVALGISKSGTTESVVNALRTAAEAGAHTVGVTCSPRSPVAEAVDVRLLAASRESWEWSHPAASHVAMHGVVEALYAYVLLLKYRSQSETLRGSEDGASATEEEHI